MSVHVFITRILDCIHIDSVGATIEDVARRYIALYEEVLETASLPQ